MCMLKMGESYLLSLNIISFQLQMSVRGLFARSLMVLGLLKKWNCFNFG
jgi:hypothetical protein